MGRAKQEWIEEEGRGWRSDDRHVCGDCVEDTALKKLIHETAETLVCDFCGRTAMEPIAAPFNRLLERIAETLFTMYGQVDEVGTPYAEGSYLSEVLTTEEVLAAIGFECSGCVWDAVVKDFIVEDWVEAPNGSWGQLPFGKELKGAWDHFCQVVRHQTRFHFHTRFHDHPQDGIAPGDMLEAIGSTIRSTSLVTDLPTGTTLYRGRIVQPGSTWEPNADSMGAPPPSIAGSGRMNPAGIPYLYLAFDVTTMVAEVGELRKDEVIRGASFRTTRALRVVNFSDLPEEPSLFDPERRHLHPYFYFLRGFVREISQPVDRPLPSDIHYVPTQVVSEYLAQAFGDSNETSIDGVVFRSAANQGGKNLVLFPSRTPFKPQFDCVQLAEHFTWNQILSLILIESRAITVDRVKRRQPKANLSTDGVE
ncbi:RES family NAD+ phosphorylase [Hydrogenophaga sp. D2P1]|jgi:RES domain-containing protein|uniref:RES family NAD+ phosphorylase n=1 Tax=Hydrogenophaga aromaticivorans TaxID=2610898 RepID=A0A7Y8GU64_9BURK|nr:MULTISPECIES: HEPN-associated N-terminal domain-containing protein [Hydrogenophaga]MCG2655917.1 RES domain-containing protein [Hydrogenophaga sp.]NWF44915.1 RES family NAD+ phosphorylase [Hydrogenophaga aromaticivorans]